MLAEPIVMMSEAQAYVRIETGEEEALLAGLIRTASSLCEAFINQVVVARDFELDLPATGNWERLPITPVRSMTAVETVGADGFVTPVDSSGYALDAGRQLQLHRVNGGRAVVAASLIDQTHMGGWKAASRGSG